MRKKTPTMRMGYFEQRLHERVMELGGSDVAHAHLDRSGTLDETYLAHVGIKPLMASRLPLQVKQTITQALHAGPAYQDSHDLERRMRQCLRLFQETGVQTATTFIDATPDIGTVAIAVACYLKRRLRERGKLNLRIAAHPIFGLKDHPIPENSCWEVFRKTCMLPEVDIIGALPEKDERPDGIGANEHLKRVLGLGLNLDKEVHVHVDQANNPWQHETLDLIQAVKWICARPQNLDAEPRVWAIHAISPSAYTEEKFRQVLEGLRNYNIGVICCPKAAITMLQLRSLNSPTHACLARVLEMALFGIRVKIGTDNIADIYIPTSSGRMIDEVVALADNLRFFDIQVLAKFAAGIPLNAHDKDSIRQHLKVYEEVLRQVAPDFKLCVDLY